MLRRQEIATHAKSNEQAFPNMIQAKKYRIHRSWTALGKLLGILLFGLALFILVIPLFDKETPWWLALPVGIFLLASSFWLLRLGFKPGVYSVKLSDEGVQGYAENIWRSWSQIANVLDRPILNRIDLIDHAGVRVGSLEYQLADFPEALETVLTHVNLTFPPQDVFRRKVAAGSRLIIGAILAVIVGFGLWGWFIEGELAGLFISALLVGAAGFDALTQLWSVSIKPDGVLIRRGARTLLVPWREIAEVELALRPIGSGNQMLDVFLVAPTGVYQHIRPLGSNPFQLKERISKKLVEIRGTD